jgi:D-glycero-D-manno-heptose 1,7-bisphosphate phosphatase
MDRDGTLNQDRGYVWRHEDWEWLPRAILALRLLTLTGIKVAVVTNQAGIARGMYTDEDVKELHRLVDESLVDSDASIAGWYHCPHHPDITGECDCRKPGPGLLQKAAQDLGVELSDCYMVGDKLSDVEAGMNAGVRLSVLVRTGHGREVEGLPEGVAEAGDVLDATRVILEDIYKRSTVRRSLD